MFRALSLYKEKLSLMSRAKQFMQLMNLYIGASYTWGAENLEQTDCSGLICGTLSLLGNKIRITADGIRRTLAVEDNSIYDEYKVKLIFFVDDKDVAKHVGVVCDNGLVLHASSPKGCLYESEGIVISRYEKRGMKAEVKTLDFSKVDDNTGTMYDLDDELI